MLFIAPGSLQGKARSQDHRSAAAESHGLDVMNNAPVFTFPKCRAQVSRCGVTVYTAFVTGTLVKFAEMPARRCCGC